MKEEKHQTASVGNQEEEEWKEERRFFKCEYFATTSKVLKVVAKTTTPQRWTDLHRISTKENPVVINVRRKSTNEHALDPYSVTRESILEAENDGVASGSLSTRTSESEKSTAAAAIWSSDIFGRKVFNTKLAQIAHVVPAGKLEHEEWFGVAGAILGLDENSSTEHKLMAIRGVNKKRKQDEIAEGGDGKKTKSARVRHSGYLHSVSNKLRLQGQAGVVEGDQPKMLIIPAMTLKQAKGWRGEGYTAAVLIGLPESDVPLGYHFDEESEKVVYTDVALNTSKLFTALKSGKGALLTLPKDEETELVQVACEALAASVLGLAQYVRTLDTCDLSPLNAKNQVLLKDRSRSKNAEVFAPQFKRHDQRPVLFVRFGAQTGNDVDLHPAPDPLGLLCKAANGWSLMVGQKLLANAKPPVLSDYDYELQEFDRRAELEYLVNSYY